MKMVVRMSLVCACAATALIFFINCDETLVVSRQGGEEFQFRPETEQSAEPIRPIPLHTKLDEKKVKLGRKLFHDTMLSSDHSISCSSCHDLKHGGADGKRRSRGVGGAEGEITAPTVYNSGLSFKQFWDGRANSLEEQVGGPLLNSNEMASDWKTVIDRLKHSPKYSQEFAEAFATGISEENIRNAIATFERSLSTPNCRFDQFLRGDLTAITHEELEGYKIFKQVGCISCHQGVAVGGNMFQPFGVMGNYFHDRGNVTKADYGRFNVTSVEADRFMFKVPSLRNVALVAPYFHDGSTRTLEEAVSIMGKYQLGTPLDGKQVRLVVKFLNTLTGDCEKW